MNRNISSLWADCLLRLQDQVPADKFQMWLRPLQADLSSPNQLTIYVQNFFSRQWVENNYLTDITKLVRQLADNPDFTVKLVEGVKPSSKDTDTSATAKQNAQSAVNSEQDLQPVEFKSGLNSNHLFENFVEGKSNQLARAVGIKVANNPGDKTANPLFLYGGTGLGKTHLLHAVGNGILANNPKARVLYIHAERFVQEYVKATKLGAAEKFKKFYRNLDALLIDDIQFFAGKELTQEEFFNTFNNLFEGEKQIILTSDRYPREIEKIEDRLKSRFSWGLSVAIEPPELETRVAILMKKAEERGVNLTEEVAFFIGQKLRTHVRELEGALNRVIANAEFTGKTITIDFVRDTLKDMLALQDKLVTIDNIQKVVAEYYRIKVSDLNSKNRSRSVARPRQLAMALAKELTNRSFPEIGKNFGGKDHTTVIYACDKIQELRETDSSIQEDWSNLIRTLSA